MWITAKIQISDNQTTAGENYKWNNSDGNSLRMILHETKPRHVNGNMYSISFNYKIITFSADFFSKNVLFVYKKTDAVMFKYLLLKFWVLIANTFSFCNKYKKKGAMIMYLRGLRLFNCCAKESHSSHDISEGVSHFSDYRPGLF